jgi:hypothetical protein
MFLTILKVYRHCFCLFFGIKSCMTSCTSISKAKEKSSAIGSTLKKKKFEVVDLSLEMSNTEHPRTFVNNSIFLHIPGV